MTTDARESAFDVCEAEFMSVHSIALRLLPAFVASGRDAPDHDLVCDAYNLATAFARERDRLLNIEDGLEIVAVEHPPESEKANPAEPVPDENDIPF